MATSLFEIDGMSLKRMKYPGAARIPSWKLPWSAAAWHLASTTFLPLRLRDDATAKKEAKLSGVRRRRLSRNVDIALPQH